MWALTGTPTPLRSMTTSYMVFRAHQNFNNFTAVLVVGLFLCERTLKKAVYLILHASLSETETHPPPQEPSACCSLPHLQPWFVAVPVLLTKHFQLFQLVHFVRGKKTVTTNSIFLFHFVFSVCCVCGLCTCRRSCASMCWHHEGCLSHPAAPALRWAGWSASSRDPAVYGPSFQWLQAQTWLFT